MIRVVHKVDGIIIRVIVEIEEMVIQGRVEHSQLERFPNLKIELTIMPS